MDSSESLSIRTLALRKSIDRFKSFITDELKLHFETPYWIVSAFESYYFGHAIPFFSSRRNPTLVTLDITSNRRDLFLLLHSFRRYLTNKTIEFREFLCALLVSVISLIWIRYRQFRLGERTVGIYIGNATKKSEPQDFRYGEVLSELKLRNVPVVFLVRSTKAVLSDFLTRREPSVYLNLLHDSMRFRSCNLNQVEIPQDFEDSLFFENLRFYKIRPTLVWILKHFRINAAYVSNLSGRTASSIMYMKFLGIKVVGSQHAASMPEHSPCEFLRTGILRRTAQKVHGPDVMGAWGEYWRDLLSDTDINLYGTVEVSGPLQQVQTAIPPREPPTYILVLDEQHIDYASFVPYLLVLLNEFKVSIKSRPNGTGYILSHLKEMYPAIYNHPNLDRSLFALPNRDLRNNMFAVICTYTSAGMELACNGFPVVYLKTEIWGNVYRINVQKETIANLRYVSTPKALLKEIKEIKLSATESEMEEFRRKYFSVNSGTKWVVSQLIN